MITDAVSTVCLLMYEMMAVSFKPAFQSILLLILLFHLLYSQSLMLFPTVHVIATRALEAIAYR